MTNGLNQQDLILKPRGIHGVTSITLKGAVTMMLVLRHNILWTIQLYSPRGGDPCHSLPTPITPPPPRCIAIAHQLPSTLLPISRQRSSTYRPPPRSFAFSTLFLTQPSRTPLLRHPEAIHLGLATRKAHKVAHLKRKKKASKHAFKRSGNPINWTRRLIGLAVHRLA